MAELPHVHAPRQGVARPAGTPELVPVPAAHRIDTAALADYLSSELEGFAGPVEIRQFQGGQSNPTYHLQAASGPYVLRKKPPGTLLPRAHAIEREHRILAALAETVFCLPSSSLNTN